MPDRMDVDPRNIRLDLWLANEIDDPYPIFEQLHRSEPVHWSRPLSSEESGAWYVAGYHDIVVLSKETRLGRHLRIETEGRASPAYRTYINFISKQLGYLPPPQHAVLRQILAPAFTPSSVSLLRPFIIKEVRKLLARQKVKSNDFDFIAELAYPLPIKVVCALLGVPTEDHDRLVACMELITGSGASSRRSLKMVNVAIEEFSGCIEDCIGRRRRDHSRDDIIGLLVDRQEEFRLTDEDIVANCFGILDAGYETTTNLLSNSLYTLMKHPEQLELLRQHSSMIAKAIEESLRYESPIQLSARWVAESFTFNGVLFEEGQSVHFLFGAAGRDPSFVSDPNHFDISRRRSGHLAFGIGGHYCLGAVLARLIGHVVFECLLNDTRSLRIAKKPSWSKYFLLRGLDELYINVDFR